MLEELPNLNIFMLCVQVDTGAFREMPQGFSVRLCRKDELPIWKRMPFCDDETARQYAEFMDDFFRLVYAPKGDLFFETCLFAVGKDDIPVGTAFLWRAYDAVTTVAWFKVKKEHEGRGIGRALLTVLMSGLQEADCPVLLHTQPGSERAIKLYSDFGFKLLTDAKVGNRTNHIDQCLPMLKATMPKEDFENLRFATAPKPLLDFLQGQTLDEF